MVIKATSCYENAKSGNLVSITGDGGHAWGFYGKTYKKMAPRLYLWQYYEKNPDHLGDDELIDWYIKEHHTPGEILQAHPQNREKKLRKLLSENGFERVNNLLDINIADRL